MEIKRLLHFRAVVEGGGIVRAAEMLHLTPGTLSKSVQQLERDLGRKLFRRDHRRLLPNDAGTRLYQESRVLVDEYARLRVRLDDRSDEPDRLRIASFEVFTTHLLGALINDGFSTTELTVRELPAEDIPGSVLSRETDLGVSYVPGGHDDLQFMPLTEVRFRAFVQRGTFADTPFAEIPFAVPLYPLRGATSELAALDGWPYGRVARLVRYQLTSLESALALGRNGHCAVFIPEFIAGIHNKMVVPGRQLQALDEPDNLAPVIQQVFALFRSDSGLGEKQQNFLQVLVDTIRDAQQAVVL